MKIALLFGANSYEHEISIVSAIALKSILRHELLFLFCDAQREWYHIPPQQMRASHFSSSDYKQNPKVLLHSGGFWQKTWRGEKSIACDCALNLIHGKDGEDGKIAAMLDFYRIPYIGPRMEASMLSYNKCYTKLLAAQRGVRALPFEVLRPGQTPSTITYPMILKPMRLGSSIGVSVVKKEEELAYALDVAFAFDSEVLVEPFVKEVKEYNLAGCVGPEGLLYSIIEEPAKNEFLDFEKKYLDFSRTKRVQEAALDPVLQQKLKQAFAAIYTGLFEGALIRCDFFVIDGEVYLNEINPIPGSMANYLFEDFNAVVDALCAALPQERTVRIDYAYIGSIHSAKGK